MSLGTAPTSINLYSDYLAFTAGKIAFSWASASTWYSNILTDTAGTATAGTAISGTSAATIGFVAAFGYSGNTCRFGVQGIDSSYSQHRQLTLDCSGSSPVLSSINGIEMFGTTSGGPAPTRFYASDFYGVKAPNKLTAGDSTYFVSGAYASDLGVYPGAVKHIAKLPLINLNALFGGTSGVSGANANESWAGYAFNSPITGFTIQRIEAAA